MNDISKQEEFLEKLKDPTKTSLKSAVARFQRNQPDITDTDIEDVSNRDGYYIHIYARKSNILFDMRQTFNDTLQKEFKTGNPLNELIISYWRTHYITKINSYCQTFYVRVYTHKRIIHI